MGKVLGGLLGGGAAGKVSAAPVVDTKEAQRTAKESRSALYATEGGAVGSELDPSKVSKRSTLLGN